MQSTKEQKHGQRVVESTTSFVFANGLPDCPSLPIVGIYKIYIRNNMHHKLNILKPKSL